MYPSSVFHRYLHISTYICLYTLDLPALPPESVLIFRSKDHDAWGAKQVQHLLSNAFPKQRVLYPSPFSVMLRWFSPYLSFPICFST